MENKKDLAKIVLAAFILASANPMSGQATNIEAEGIILAVSCAAHGCPAVQSHDTRANNLDSSNQNDMNSRDRTTANYDYNRTAVANSASSATLTEAQLLSTLNAQGREIYLNLDPEGKALAIQLASQDSYRDKNLAIKEAERRSNERRGSVNR